MRLDTSWFIPTEDDRIPVFVLDKTESLRQGSPWYKVTVKLQISKEYTFEQKYLAFRHGVEPSFKACCQLGMHSYRWGSHFRMLHADDRLMRCTAMGVDMEYTDKPIVRDVFSLYAYTEGVQVLREWIEVNQSQFFSGKRATKKLLNLHKECLELAKALLNCYCIHGNIREEAVLVVQHPTASGFEAKLLLGDYSQAQYANPDGRAMVPIPYDGPSIVWEALEQQIAWEPKTVSRWDYKMLMDFATIAGVEAGGMMPTAAVWSCQTNVYQLAAMQHFAVTGRSHLSDGKVLVSLPDPFLAASLRACLCDRQTDRLLPSQLAQHMVFWVDETHDIKAILKDMHALLAEGRDSEDHKKFCRQLSKQVGPILQKAKFDGIPEFQGLLALLAHCCHAADPSLSNRKIKTMVYAIKRCMEVHRPGLSDKDSRNTVKAGAPYWDYTCPEISVREIANLVCHWLDRKKVSKAKFLRRKGVVNSTGLAEFVSFLLHGLAEFLAAAYTALCSSNLEGGYWRQLVGLSTAEQHDEGCGTVWQMMVAIASTAQSREQDSTCSTPEGSNSSDSSNSCSSSSGGNNRVEAVNAAASSLPAAALSTGDAVSSGDMAATIAAAEETDCNAAEICHYTQDGGFVLERMSAWDQCWSIARYLVRSSLHLLYNSYLQAINYHRHPAYVADRVYSCAEDVVLSRLAGAMAIKILLGAISVHLVHIRCQQRAGRSRDTCARSEQRLLALVTYLRRSYPTFTCPGELEEDYLLPLMLHRVMMCLCSKDPSLSLQQRSQSALEELKLFEDQARYRPMQSEHHAQVGFLRTLLQHLQADDLQPAVKLLAGCPYPLLHLWMHILPERPSHIRIDAAKQLRAKLNGAPVSRLYMATELGYIYTGDPLMIQLGTLQFNITQQNKLQVYGNYGIDRLHKAKQAVQDLVNHLDVSPGRRKAKRMHAAEHLPVQFFASPDAVAVPDDPDGEDAVAAVQPVQLMY